MNVATVFRVDCPVHLESGSCAGAVCREGKKPAADAAGLPAKQFEVERLSLSPEARMLLRSHTVSGDAHAASNEEPGMEIHGGESHLHGEHEDDDDHDEHGKAAQQAAAVARDKLTVEELRELQQLRARDREVRAHEQAHVAASGSIAVSGPTYGYEEGPDGRRYAVEGKVNYQVPPAHTPEEEVRLAQQLRRMALAPANPSATDRAAAAKAAVQEAQARQELHKENVEEAKTVADTKEMVASGVYQKEAYAGSSGLLQSGLLISTEA